MNCINFALAGDFTASSATVEVTATEFVFQLQLIIVGLSTDPTATAAIPEFLTYYITGETSEAQIEQLTSVKVNRNHNM